MGKMVRCRNGYSLWITFFFLRFADKLVQFYPELFEGGGSASQHQANFGKKWGTYATIVELAENDILRFDKVVEEELEKCLLFLAYKADKAQLETLMNRELMSSHK
jgi:hypothetical protein